MPIAISGPFIAICEVVAALDGATIPALDWGLLSALAPAFGSLPAFGCRVPSSPQVERSDASAPV
ncbi:hypothetical protein BraRD5C2_39380 [Bradyrhizobium sp. RD5-C2]|nr:hypothetical protein BraRD5C2_39380 [Bradyrhizobium sp. RD5-C2]